MKRLSMSAIFIILIAILDQYSKWYVFHQLLSHEQPYLNVTSFFNVVMVRNYGVSFGMLSNIPYGLLSAIVMIIVICLSFWLVNTTKRYETIGLSLVISGALGNLIDRIRDGSVADFLDFHINNLHWPAFNIADIGAE